MEHLLPRQVPSHHAIAQGKHLIGDSGINQRLTADDTARAPGAVDHHRGIRGAHDFVHAVGQLATGTANAARQGQHAKFLFWAAVEKHHVGAFVLHLLQRFRGDGGRAFMLLNKFPEGLAGHINPIE